MYVYQIPRPLPAFQCCTKRKHWRLVRAWGQGCISYNNVNNLASWANDLPPLPFTIKFTIIAQEREKSPAGQTNARVTFNFVALLQPTVPILMPVYQISRNYHRSIVGSSSQTWKVLNWPSHVWVRYSSSSPTLYQRTLWFSTSDRLRWTVGGRDQIQERWSVWWSTRLVRFSSLNWSIGGNLAIECIKYLHYTELQVLAM